MISNGDGTQQAAPGGGPFNTARGLARLGVPTAFLGRRSVMLDPNIRVGLITDSMYRDRLQAAISKSTIVKASEADLAWLYPGLGYEQGADRILDEGVRLVVVTLGARGAFGGQGDTRILVDAPHVDVVDTIGAGDAFSAA